jgi:hypothetical protein
MWFTGWMRSGRSTQRYSDVSMWFDQSLTKVWFTT